MDIVKDVLFFLQYCNQQKIKINKEQFYDVVGYLENYEQFNFILNLFKEFGMKPGVRFYESLNNFYCDYYECREVLDYLLSMSRNKFTGGYYIQLILLSSSKEEAIKIFNEAKINKVSLSEKWIDRYGDNKLVQDNFKGMVNQFFKYRQNKFYILINEMKKI